MASSLQTSFLGAVQAALSVLLTLSYGIAATRFGLIHDGSVNDISQLCVKMFLPALLLTNVGSNLDLESVGDYIPVFIWAVVYALVSIGIGMSATRLFKLPAWTTPAMAFNNSTSLPLLLVTALASTGILRPIAGDSMDAVDRAKSYFLINSMVSNTMTFALGPRLMKWQKAEAGDADANDEGVVEDNEEEEADEETSLLPRPVATRKAVVERKFNTMFHALPPRVQSCLSSAAETVNPPMQGAILAAIIGLIPPLHKAFFAEMEDGGVLNAWLTSSLKNIGELFTALQMFVVGSQLEKSLSGEEEIGRVPKRALALLFAVRFLVWPAISIPAVYMLAKNTTLLGNDPMMWFAMMLMPVGPPAMMLSALVELEGEPQAQKMAVARVLTYFYAITPVICFAVVGSLKACEMALEKR